MLVQVPPRHSSGSRAHSSTSGSVEGHSWHEDAGTRGHDVARSLSPWHPGPITPAEARKAWRFGALMTRAEEFEPGEAARQMGRETGILRRIRTTRLTLLESLKEALRNPPGGHGRQARPSPARHQCRAQGPRHPPHHLPHTPVSRASFYPSGPPRASAHAVFLQALFGPSSPHLLSLSQPQPQAPQMGHIPQAPFPVMLTVAILHFSANLFYKHLSLH